MSLRGAQRRSNLNPRDGGLPRFARNDMICGQLALVAAEGRAGLSVVDEKPLLPRNELPGYGLSPAGLGWSGHDEFLPAFRFLHNIRASRSADNRSAAAGGGGHNQNAFQP